VTDNGPHTPATCIISPSPGGPTPHGNNSLQTLQLTNLTSQLLQTPTSIRKLTRRAASWISQSKNYLTSAPEQVTPTGELKASDLYRDRGMRSTYNPPTSEFCYLGVDQPKPDPRYNARPVQDLRKRKRGSSTSLATVSEQGDEDARPKPTTSPTLFTRQVLKRVNTSSELTRSFEIVSIKEEKNPTLAEKFAFEGLNCEDLPSAFDSDDEEEDYDIRNAR
jgi:hypothetical protein